MIGEKEKKPIATIIACCLSFLYGTYLFIFVRILPIYGMKKIETETNNFLTEMFVNTLAGTVEILSELDRLMFCMLIFAEILVVVILIAFIIISIATRKVWSYIIVFSLSGVFLVNMTFWNRYPIFVIINILFIILIEAFAFYDYRRIKKQVRMRKLQSMQR